MRSAMWSTLVCMAPPAGCGFPGRARARRLSVAVGEHRDEVGERRGEAARVEGLVRAVRELLADDAGQQHGPVTLDVHGLDVGSDETELLETGEPCQAEVVELDRGCVGLVARPEPGHGSPEQ